MRFISDADFADGVYESLNHLHLHEHREDTESETETLVSVPQDDHNFGAYFPQRAAPQKTGDSQQKIVNKNTEHTENSDDAEDMGTLLIGETLPGYYANPVRISPFSGRSRQSPFDKGKENMLWGSGGYGGVHLQSAASELYSDGV